MERLKPMQRNATAASEASERYRPELIAEEEPRYLRRQKPVEIRRKKLGGRGWTFYRRVLVFTVTSAAIIAGAYYGTQFVLYSPSMLLLKPEQIELTGNHVVTREAVLRPFAQDRNRSVLQIPLDARRSQVEQIPWVESATVHRILPNRIRVELTERTPVAFARNGNEVELIDPHGAILDRPQDTDYQFPVVTGVPDDMSRDQREKRMQLFQEFMKDIELVRGGASQAVSEVDLSIPKDLRVVLTGLASPTDTQAVTVHFGSSDFSSKFKMLVDNFSQWRAHTGRVQSIDLQYTRQVVVNPDTSAGAMTAKTK
ncbi:MAG TPA: FtsQ-type POTRA domain-containing protein [Candidatus Acidoferrum sp.]|nr:FtsQ-type POTRA domain-containing protein [Candidatus Acidoferrum sp.]